jgi:[acyl-carrier-protein] S-malonyltransferase
LIKSILFPAFVNEYTGTESEAISRYSNNFNKFLSIASEFLKSDLTGFDFRNNNFLDSEVKSQYISYLFSCTVADILKEQGIKPDYVSGYSMGIYAALYYCGTITFNEGLLLVKSAWDEISRVTANGKFTMGMIVGLNHSEIQSLLLNIPEVEICNQNNLHTFIVSGSFSAVNQLLSSAKEEGALRTNQMPVTKPYHSKLVKEAVRGFLGILNTIGFTNPAYKYVSSMDQKIMVSSHDLKNELIENLFCRMNWYQTMNFLVKKETGIFFECGGGNGLTRNNRFIEGDFISYPVSKLNQFLETDLKKDNQG